MRLSHWGSGEHVDARYFANSRRAFRYFFAALAANFQRAFDFGSVRCQQDPAICFDRQNTVAGFQPEPISHIPRQ
jgi:hypothetical protein